MSHRAYLYNVNTPSVAEETDTMMMEWGYEMPLMLQPLLISGGFISGNNYNNHIPFNDSGLYYDAQPGIENLKQFYNFLEAQPAMINHIERFKVAREKLFNFLDRLEGNYFHLDMWDVLNMEDTPHDEQAAEWLATIAHNNRIITNAMQQGDINLLKYNELKDVSPAFTSFTDLLNFESYDYGWSCIWVPFEEELPYEIFQENELWGLKEKDGEVRLSPQFDEFFSFGPHDLAVVSKDGKYGYVDTSGRVTVPLIWDDAFDFEYSGAAVVALSGKMGLIDVNGNQLTELKYDELEALGDGHCFNAKKDGVWGAVDQSGKEVIAFEHLHEIQASYGFYHSEISGHTNQKIFNESLKYVGEFPVEHVENLEYGLLLIGPHKGVNFSSIYKKDGTLLDSGFEKINRQTNFPDLLVIRKAKKFGAISRKKEDYVLPYQFDAILDLDVTIEGLNTDIALVHHIDKKGVFNGHPEVLTWIIPLDSYQQVKWLHAQVFALQRNQKWSIANPSNNSYSEFAFDFVVPIFTDTGFAYAFKDDEVYTVSETDIQPSNKTEALQYANDDYSYYFEYECRKKLLIYGKGQKNG